MAMLYWELFLYLDVGIMLFITIIFLIAIYSMQG